jgi:hypothetical protein
MPDNTSTDKRARYAKASFTLGLVSCCCWFVIWLLGPFGIALSVITSLMGISIGAVALCIALIKPAQHTTQKVAVKGIIISFLGILPLAIFLPSILTSKTSVNEAVAFSSLVDISNAELEFKAKKNRYGTLEELANEGLISFELGKGNNQGYQFELTQIGDTFEISAIPQLYHVNLLRKTGRLSFYMDGSGKIHSADKNGEKANINDPLNDAYR